MANKKLVAELSVESDLTAHAHNCYAAFFSKNKQRNKQMKII